MPGPTFALGSLTYIADLNTLSNGLYTPSAQTVGFTAVRGFWYFLKNDGVTVTLPLAPATGDRIRFSPATAAVRAVTLGRNGQPINSGALDVTVNPEVEIVYIDATIGWRVRSVKNGPRNVIINGGFTINQRGYVSAAALAATSFGHDRWKAGAGGGDYSFTQLASNTVITIAANKTLIQVIEDKMVLLGGTWVLSWKGTAQARVGINTATPAGAFASSPIVLSGQTAGTTMSVEFGNGASSGTLDSVQLEPGPDPSDFELRPYEHELILCLRYLPVINGVLGAYPNAGMAISTTQAIVFYMFKVPPRIPPTGATIANVGSFSLRQASGALNALTGLALNTVSLDGAELLATIAAANLVGGNAANWGTNAVNAQALFTGCEL